mmetsp:Transcript_61324/g.200541  ORF Transcript_61324/g.200541 Transcript_61324/m.200541 type:complete len:250 (+) Transcript_61324:1649-2398(+)
MSAEVICTANPEGEPPLFSHAPFVRLMSSSKNSALCSRVMVWYVKKSSGISQSKQAREWISAIATSCSKRTGGRAKVLSGTLRKGHSSCDVPKASCKRSEVWEGCPVHGSRPCKLKPMTTRATPPPKSMSKYSSGESFLGLHPANPFVHSSRACFAAALFDEEPSCASGNSPVERPRIPATSSWAISAARDTGAKTWAGMDLATERNFAGKPSDEEHSHSKHCANLKRSSSRKKSFLASASSFACSCAD